MDGTGWQRALHAELVGHRRDVLGADVERQLRVDGVVRLERRLLDRDRARVRVAVGRNVPRRDRRIGLVREGRRHVGRGRGVDALVDGGREHERLEGRAGLPPRLGDQVELVLHATGIDGGHRADRAVRGIDRDERCGGVVLLVQRLRDRVVRRALERRVDRGVDAQAARLDGLDAVLRDQLVADEAEEVRLADLRVQATGLEVQAPIGERDLELGVGDVVVDVQRVQHICAPGERVVRMQHRVVQRRRLREACDQRRLHHRQVLRRLREIGLRGGLDTVGVVAEVDLVHPGGEDALLRPVATELDRQAGLSDLPFERPLPRDVEVADELLRDRRAALDDLALVQVAQGGAERCPRSRRRRAGRSGGPRPRSSPSRSMG